MSHPSADEMPMKRFGPAAAVAAASAIALLAGSSAQALRVPAARHCHVFPANNAWRQRVDKLAQRAEQLREAL